MILRIGSVVFAKRGELRATDTAFCLGDVADILWGIYFGIPAALSAPHE